MLIGLKTTECLPEQRNTLQSDWQHNPDHAEAAAEGFHLHQKETCVMICDTRWTRPRELTWTGSLSHVQLTMRPFDKQTSAEWIRDIREELPPNTPRRKWALRTDNFRACLVFPSILPALMASHTVRSGTLPCMSSVRWTDSRIRVSVDKCMPPSTMTLSKERRNAEV